MGPSRRLPPETSAAERERRNLKEALREKERIIRQVAELTPVVLDIFDLVTERPFYFGRDGISLYGYTVEEMRQMKEPLRAMIDTKDLPRVREHLQSLRQASDNQIHEIEFRILHRDGKWRWIASRSMPFLRDENGQVRQIISTTFDVTARKQAEELLQKHQEELEQRVAERTAALTELTAMLQEQSRERDRIESERQRLLRRIVLMQEEERRRISREMHDQFGQQLSVLTLKLAALKVACGEQRELCEQIGSLQAIAKQLDADVDFLVWHLRPTALDDLGLLAALTDYVKKWSQHSGIHADVHASGMRKTRLPGEIETVLYRSTQEALTNIAKHAEARKVDILLESRQDYVSLIIEDDGVGFEEEQAFGRGHRGLGLIGMRERAGLVGGNLQIESRPGSGATIAIRIPLPHIPSGEKPSE
jgi:PAS domain S-box-containing protein